MPSNRLNKARSHEQKRKINQQQIKKLNQDIVSKQELQVDNMEIEKQINDTMPASKIQVQEIHVDNIKKKKYIQLKLIADSKTKQIRQIEDYVHIKKNIYVDMNKPKQLPIYDWFESNGNGNMQNGCIGSDLYCAFTECHLRAHGDIDCGNQRMQRRQFAKTYVASAGDRGRGLYCDQKQIRIGSLITEYVGEVINEERLFERLNKEHFYSVFLGKFKDLEGKKRNFYIDSSLKGNEARFINHSCDPNAEARFVEIGNEKRVGLFAIKQIKQGEEITFDYCLQTLSENAIPCLCGSANCSGFIGKSK